MEEKSETRTNPAPIRSVLVGVDGSPASSSALEWGHQLAGADGVVHAVHVVEPGEPDGPARERAESDWFAPSSDQSFVRVEGDRLTEILAHATNVDADVVLVGSHGRSKLGPRVVGRLTSALLRRADRPVGVVPEGRYPPIGPSTTILVAVRHGRPSALSLRWAAALASTHGARLSLFTAVPNHPVFRPDRILDTLAYYVDPGLVSQWALDDLDDLAEQLQEATEQDLTITTATASGSKRTLTLDRSRTSNLLVVDLQPGGMWLGHAMPGALHHALTHAPCPVVLVPDDEPCPDPLSE